MLILGEYVQNLCKTNGSTCQPCPDRLPSCVGLSDGNHAFPTRLWKPDYITCYKDRTVNTDKCTDGYFHPHMEMCVTFIIRSKFMDFYTYYNYLNFMKPFTGRSLNMSFHNIE